MNIVYQILLVLLFLTIGSVDFSSLSLAILVILVGSVWIITKKGKLRVPRYIALAFGVYLLFLLIGILNHHDNPTIDIKFQFYGFLFYIFLLNTKNFNVLRFLFILNAIILLLYVLLYLGFMPNLWHSTIIGFRGRVYGPAITPIVLIAFYYLYKGRTFDVPLALSYAIALPYLILTVNLMNMVIAGGLLFLIIINFQKLLKPGYIIAIILFIVGAVFFFKSEFAPELVKEKLPYVLKPWEYESFKIRIEDFEKALKSERFTLSEKMFGEGYGASTTIYRENQKVQAFSDFFTFQEIDNGFYYIYHRGGFLLLFIFFITHLYLLLKIQRTKAQFGFLLIVVFTCLLSIHYFNNVFYLLIPFLILEIDTEKKNESRINRVYEK